ncbi:hypothetical protein ONZ45_g16726 [Pleurotus djamor]|nr:hypothetical protein ONZ45_g16726 [Pleurotus djamor]
MQTVSELVLPKLAPFFMFLTWVPFGCEGLAILASRSQGGRVAATILEVATLGAPEKANDIGVTPYFIVGWTLMLSGAALRAWCYRVLGHRFTFRLSIRQNHDHLEKDEEGGQAAEDPFWGRVWTGILGAAKLRIVASREFKGPKNVRGGS